MLFRQMAVWLGLAMVVAFVVYRVKLAPIPVQIHTVSRSTLVAEVLGTGTLEARISTVISPRIQERLADVLVDQNDPVKAGQVLARLDDRELTVQVEVAEAVERAARASLDRVRTDEARALAVEQQARLNHQRVADLVTTKVASQDALDKALEALQVAGADLKRAQAAIVEAEHQLGTAGKNLAYHRERLGFAQLRSPYDGLVVRRDRDPGGVVVPGSSILEVISTNELWISAWVDETALARLAPDQPARVVFRSDPGQAHPGRVVRLGRETDRETREFLVDVQVEALPHNWAVGQRAEVYIETDRKETPVVPLRFVVWRGGKPGVFVNAGGRARWREVQAGLRGQEALEITAGLKEGEQVFMPLSKQPPLKDGQRVVIP
jgi:HlyD family secretion protein